MAILSVRVCSNLRHNVSRAAFPERQNKRPRREDGRQGDRQAGRQAARWQQGLLSEIQGLGRDTSQQNQGQLLRAGESAPFASTVPDAAQVAGVPTGSSRGGRAGLPALPRVLCPQAESRGAQAESRVK